MENYKQKTLFPVTRIILRPIGSPLPLGFFAFGVGMLITGAYELHWIAASETQQLVMVIMGFVFPFEFIPGLLAFFSRDTAGATTLMIFSGSWIVTALILLIEKSNQYPATLGFFYFSESLITLLLAIAAWPAKPFFSFLLISATSRFILSGLIYTAKLQSLIPATGILGLALCVIAFYGAIALLIEDVKQKSILPLFRRGPAGKALEGDLWDQISRINNEAGVRQQL